jgi:hypothetical protein
MNSSDIATLVICIAIIIGSLKCIKSFKSMCCTIETVQSPDGTVVSTTKPLPVIQAIYDKLTPRIKKTEENTVIQNSAVEDVASSSSPVPTIPI